MKKVLTLIGASLAIMLASCGSNKCPDAAAANAVANQANESGKLTDKNRLVDRIAQEKQALRLDNVQLEKVRAAKTQRIQIVDPKMLPATAAAWIKAYQQSPYFLKSDPLSMLINTQSLIGYLTTQPKARFLHLYLCQTGLQGRMDLTVIGADSTIRGTDTTYSHIYSSTPGKVFSNFADAYNAGVKYDSLDPSMGNTLNFVGVSDNVASIYDTLAQSNISSYQYYEDTDASLTYSFLIDAGQLKSFLTTPALQSPATTGGNNVPYLQVYFAYKNATPGDANLTLILVGVNSAGKHVYYKAGGINYVFEQCVPCPECAIDPDKRLDGPVDAMGH